MPRKDFIDTYCKNITRKGNDAFLQWLLTTDFFTAPASSRFHGSYEGGLCEHSLCVYENLTKLLEVYPEEITVSAESVAIVALLHDVCKIGTYKTDYRNVKNEQGIWEKVPYYAYDETFAYGNHGGKSVYLIMQYMQLTRGEAVAIQCHMGNEDGKYTTTNSYKQYPLAWLLHVADEAATYIHNK